MLRFGLIRSLVFVAVLLQAMAIATAVAADLTLKFDRAAANTPQGWERESFPIGNGRIGGNFFGGLASDRLAFNDVTLWTGNERLKGSFQAFGNLTIALPGHDAGASDYLRELDLDQGVGQVTYKKDGVTYRREYFASFPAQAIVVRLSADRPGAYTGEVALADMHEAPTVVNGDTLSAKGVLTVQMGLPRPRGRAATQPQPATVPDHTPTMQYESRVKVLHEGGSIAASGNKITFSGCDSVTLILVAGTDYIPDYARGFHGEAPAATLDAQLQRLSGKSYAALLDEHQQDYRSLFHRVSYDLGQSTPQRQAMSLDKRLEAFRSEAKDPGLEALFAQYGRYLLISSSRNSLPANLQGLWSDRNNPAWQADYHTNINIQMNYWAAETTNLSECHRPLFAMVDSLVPAWRKATASLSTARDARDRLVNAAGKPVRGWTVRTEHNPYGNMSYTLNKTGNAWYAQHYWEHYAFTQDKKFLAETAYPLMKEVCEFWEDYLKVLPDGTLVAPTGWSPEHGPREDGTTYDQMIIWDLFNNTVEAADVLGTDKEFRDKVAAMRDKLAKPKVGSWGQLLEWMEEKTDDATLDKPTDQHRHTSHLFGVYPGRQISTTLTPELAKAAAISLKARGEAGDSRRSWTWAWRTALWARLGDAEMAHHTLQGLLIHNTMNNFWTVHPPYQIDGNLGIAGAIPEMLLQSHAGEINLLPALPAAWPNGSVKGLRARGGFEVSMTWQNGKLATATIKSINGTGGKARYAGKLIELNLKPGESRTIGPDL